MVCLVTIKQANKFFFKPFLFIFFQQPKRFEYSLKSPGIKPNSLRTSTRGHFFPTLLPTGTGTGGYKILNDTEDVDPQSPLQTPPPCSPTDVFEPASPTKPGSSGINEIEIGAYKLKADNLGQ